MKLPLMKYQCEYLDCWREFLTMQMPTDREDKMVCPFCKSSVQSVAGGDVEIQDFYEEMGCLYPGGTSI